MGMLTFQSIGSQSNSVPGDPRSPRQMDGRQFEAPELSAPETPASRGPEMAAGPPSSPHLGKLLLGDGAGSHPAAVHPAVGPRATPLPGPRVCTSRDPPPAPQRGSAVLTSSPRAGSRAPTSFRGAPTAPRLEPGPALPRWPGPRSWRRRGRHGVRMPAQAVLVRPCVPHPRGRLGLSRLPVAAPASPPPAPGSRAAYLVLGQRGFHIDIEHKPESTLD